VVSTARSALKIMISRFGIHCWRRVWWSSNPEAADFFDGIY
jgi:hypothetical protein